MEGLSVEQLNASQVNEFQQLIVLFNKVFESPEMKVADAKYCQSLLNKRNFLAFAAINEGKIIAGITAHVLPSYYNGNEELFIYDLAVSEIFQRKGVGRNLMKALFAEAAKREIKVAFVDAENEDAEALQFYEALGGEKMMTTQFTFHI